MADGYDGFMQLMGQFKQNLGGLMQNRALAQANEQVQQIKQAEGDEMEKRQKFTQVAQGLTNQLLQYGMPENRIQLAAQQIAPKQFANPDQMIFEGYQTGNQGMVDMGTKAAKAVNVGEMDMFQAKVDAQTKATLQTQQHESDMLDKRLKAMLEKGNKEHLYPITQGQGEDLVALDKQGLALDDIQKDIDMNPNLLNKAYNKFPGARAIVDSDFAVFDAKVGRMFQEYKKWATGASAPEKEMEELLKNQPNINDTSAAFQKKLKFLKNYAPRLKYLMLKELKKQKRDVSGYAEDMAGFEGNPININTTSPQTSVNEQGDDFFTPFK
jgi:hypothetical protein